MNTTTPSPDAEDSVVSDEALLIAVGNNQDVDAFNQLFTRFAKKILALGMKLTRNEQLANDLIQESMLNVWLKAPLYDLDKGSAKGWIFTLSRNRCFDMLRKQKRQPNCISADDIWPLESGAEPTMVHEDIAGQQVELSVIEGYFDKLPDSQRAVVEQIYIKDRTHEEAAAHLQIPLGTLKSRLRLGVAKLRNMIGVDQ
ncbi:MAG: sigma-70 family RNA polymerase sigma factor [Proteobacteria bacterium]|nr:sigma-70 family RNA polymerase sigma factor [Pseudomonadota bacterium]MDA1289603.1 sigma-70 family RNA polymerase sigma factor [Pseudomonadota bacterium]